MSSAKAPLKLVIFLSASACASHQDKHGLFDSPSIKIRAASQAPLEEGTKLPSAFRK
ncbi:hypothetical protein [Pseudovibrio sp. Ad37]|uniref:hypothetical protein n=1 Tax=Pseudovibrio sp. Ad37 TaxID=989422 RepID=UPI00187D5A70|nr:hypothetical protein [Pseudovibrio sp. Ad37]